MVVVLVVLVSDGLVAVRVVVVRLDAVEAEVDSRVPELRVVMALLVAAQDHELHLLVLLVGPMVEEVVVIGEVQEVVVIVAVMVEMRAVAAVAPTRATARRVVRSIRAAAAFRAATVSQSIRRASESEVLDTESRALARSSSLGNSFIHHPPRSRGGFFFFCMP